MVNDISDDEFGSGDDLFVDIAEEDLLQPAPAKRQRGSATKEVSSPPQSKRARHGSLDQATTAPDQQMSLGVAQSILDKVFGYKSFRHEQEAAIRQVLSDRNALVIFPTGAGKSLCYQIPAIAFEQLDRQTNQRQPGESGITIVVSPLIALMKDQVDTLKRKGIAADCLDSTKSWEEVQQITDSLRKGQLRLLYCAPERLNNEGFVETIKSVRGGVRLIGVDEAHCISEWGHSFRPDYLKVARFVQEIKAEKVICLTATATPRVADDICKNFNVPKDGVFRTSPYRPNLRLETTAVPKQEEKMELLLTFLTQHSGPTLVYVTTHKQAEDVSAKLNANKFRSSFFHAGMSTDDKKIVQAEFMASRVPIVVATIAFGMGIDKSDIRNVVHWDLPNTVEEYCQQVGRAGRDGKPSQCELYLCPDDFHIKESFARGDLPSLHSVRDLLKDIFNDEVVKLSKGDSFKTSHYEQSSQFDIRQNPLGVIYASLELRFNLIRAITPEYSSYKFESMANDLSFLKRKKTPEADAILAGASKAKKFYTVDPTAMAKATGLRRNDLIRVLNECNDTGAIKLKVGGVMAKYKVLSKLPQSKAEIDALTNTLYADLKKREEQGLAKIQEVIKFITTPKCFARSIAEHFGMNLPNDKRACGHCTFCLDGKPIEVPPASPQQMDKQKIKKVLAETDVRDDARFLARVAFGINSPRIQKLKLNKSPAFMSMADQDFELILNEFMKECGGKAK